MDEAPFVSAIKEARQELYEINTRLQALEQLRQRKAQLEEFIEVTAGLLHSDISLERMESLPSPAARHNGGMTRVSDNMMSLPENRLWEAIQVIMQLEKKPMTAGEVLVSLDEMKVSVQGVHRRETVRAAISRKEDVFEKVGRGMFALREWPDRLKHSRQNDPASEPETLGLLVAAPEVTA